MFLWYYHHYEGINNKDKHNVTCEKCGFNWMSKSERLFISCPNCLRKTKNTPQLAPVLNDRLEQEGYKNY
jgi:protein-arginine kinase activator protein McsA